MSNGNVNGAFNTNANANLIDITGNDISIFQPLLPILGFGTTVVEAQESGISYAVGKLDSVSNTRPVIVYTNATVPESNGYNVDLKVVLKFTLTTGGISSASFDYLTSNIGTSVFNSIEVPSTQAFINDQNNSRSELEIYVNSNGTYKIALTTGLALVVYQLDNTLNYIPNSIRTLDLRQSNIYDKNAHVRGIEFSPNGEFIYFTHKPNLAMPNAIDCWNIQNNNDLVNLPYAQYVDREFQYSFIEIQNGKLYLPISNQLAEISNANTPNSSMISDFNSSFLQINYTENYWSFTDLFLNGYSPTLIEQLKAYTLPDQIDGENYIVQPDLTTPEDRACCATKSKYDVETFSANIISDPNFTSTTQTWTPTNNPLNGGTGNIVYVRNEINIPAGYNITIKDMIILFHPDAEVNVKRGTNALKGGNLTIRNSTLSIDNRCMDDLFWQGIDVEGYPNLPQIPLSNTQQGQLLVFQNSFIERARVGAEAIQKNANNASDPTYAGGVIRSSNSTWLNNWLDIKLQNYHVVSFASNTINQSTISNNRFVTDMYIGPNPKHIVHINLFDVNKVYIQGNEFINEVPNLYSENNRGFGVLAYNSQFVVRPFGFSQIPTSFTNLYMGVYAQSGNSMNMTMVHKTTFVNNQYGVIYNGFQSGRVTESYFEVAENSIGNNTAGIYLTNCTGYRVENNNLQSLLSTSTNENSYGIVVNNSGTADNFIYRNQMGDLKIGGQSQQVNAPFFNGTNDSGGLKWQCNDFVSNVNVADLSVTSGQIDQQQGVWLGYPPYNVLTPQFAGARNRFSHDNLTTEYDIAVNLINTQGFTYRYYESNPITQPLDGIYTYQQVSKGNVSFPNYIFNYEQSCPNKVKPFGTIVNGVSSGPKNKQLEIDALNSFLAGTNQQAMLDAIGNLSNGQLRNLLISNSPYVSDEVLVSYIESNPPNGHLLQVLFNNGPLSQTVLDALNDNNALPGFWLNILSNYFEGVSPYNQVLNEIAYLTAQKNYLIDDAIGYFLLEDTISVNPIDSVIALLSQENNKLREQQMVDAYIYKKALGTAEIKKIALEQTYGTDYFTTLATERINNTYGVCVVTNIDTNSTSKGIVEGIANNTTDKTNADKAKCYLYDFLKADGIDIIIEDLIIDGVVKSMTGVVEYDEIPTETIEDKNPEFEMTIYPNPTTEIVNVSIQGLNDENTIFKVVSVSGKVVYTQKATNTVATVDVSKLPKGMYFILVRNASKVFKVEKLVIE